MIVTRMLEVTSDDILYGEPGYSRLCPFARAIKREYGCDVHVGPTYIWSDTGPMIKQTKRVQKAISLYDDTRQMKPGRYKVSFPAQD